MTKAGDREEWGWRPVCQGCDRWIDQDKDPHFVRWRSRGDRLTMSYLCRKCRAGKEDVYRPTPTPDT